VAEAETAVAVAVAAGALATQGATAAATAEAASVVTRPGPGIGRGPWATRGAFRPTARTIRAGRWTVAVAAVASAVAASVAVASAAAAVARGGTPVSATWPPTCERRSGGPLHAACNSGSRTRIRGGRLWPGAASACCAVAAAEASRPCRTDRGQDFLPVASRRRRWPPSGVTAAAV